jgi:hypothetical protein
MYFKEEVDNPISKPVVIAHIVVVKSKVSLGN